MYKEGPLTSLGCNDGDVVPVLAFSVQLCGGGDEASVWGDAKQSLWVWLRINGEPGEEETGQTEQRDEKKKRVEGRSKQRWQWGAKWKKHTLGNVWASDKEFSIQMAKELI